MTKLDLPSPAPPSCGSTSDVSNMFNLRQDIKEPVFVFEPPSGGDISLRSADGSVFRVHSVILGLVSSVFSDMFAIGRPTGEVIQLDDDSESISLLLAFVYPSSVTPTIDKVDVLEKCLKVAQKYNVEKITRTLDRDLSLSEAKTGLIRHNNPLLIFRLAVTYGLRECQTLAARAITPRHVDFLQPAEIVKAAQEHPTAAHVIGLIGVQTLRAKILSDCLFTFKGSILPVTYVVAKLGQTSGFTDDEGGELMMCDDCAVRADNFLLRPERPIHYAPSWIYQWARLAYKELINRSPDECSHLFDVEILGTYVEDSLDACQDCVQAAISARPNCYDGRPGDVFESWASGVRARLRNELAVLDCLYSL